MLIQSLDNSQLPELWLNIGEFEEDGLVWNVLVVEHQADLPDDGGEACVLDTCKIVQDNLRLSVGGHCGAVDPGCRS